MAKERIFSGIQPTGVIHVGNYVGAINNWVKLLDEYECIFSIVDYHAITIEYDVKDFRENIIRLFLSCLQWKFPACLFLILFSGFCFQTSNYLNTAPVSMYQSIMSM